MKKITLLVTSLATFLTVLPGMSPVLAAEIKMSLLPATGSYSVGDKLVVAINLQSAGEAVISADAQLSFDPNLLQVQSVNGSLADFSYIDNVENSSGRVVVSAIMSDIFSDGAIVNGEFAQVVFRVHSPGSARVELVYDPQDQGQDSSVATLKGSGDQLGSVSPASYLLVGASEPITTSSPTAVPTSLSAPLTATTPASIEPTSAPTADVNVSRASNQLPQTGSPQTAYLLAGIANLLILIGARLISLP